MLKQMWSSSVTSDSAQQLQAMLDALGEFCAASCMLVNEAKSHVVVFNSVFAGMRRRYATPVLERASCHASPKGRKLLSLGSAQMRVSVRHPPVCVLCRPVPAQEGGCTT